MLSLTKKTSYGLIAMSHLARQAPGQVISASRIAEMYAIPMALLMNVLKELAAAGYVESTRGAHGGYRLARRPEEINLADLVAAVERPMRDAACKLSGGEELHECSGEDMARCPLADPVHRVHRKLNDFLRKVTLADITEPSVVAK